jgi:hypothetical protein
MFRVSGGRWSAVVGKVEPGTFGDPELDLQIKVFCGRVQVMCEGFCPVQKRAAGPSDAPTVLDYVGLFDFTLSDTDIYDLLHLMSVTDTLCQCLHDGGTIPRLCARHGLRPLRERKLRRKPGRPSALAIRVDDLCYLVRPPLARDAERELRGGLYR